MEQFFIDNRTLIEGLAFLSTIIIALVGVIGLRQLFLMKIDIRSRNDRAAKEKAIEAASAYLNEYCDLGKPFLKFKIDEKLGSYNGPITTFTKNSIPKEEIAKTVSRYKSHLWLNQMNKLESISAIFSNGVADEKLGFQIIGRTFCSTVECHYDIISFSRDGDACDYYENIVSLYQSWRPRLKKAELETTKNELENEISKIKDKEITSINPEI